jgi:hypothetical protein
MNHSGSKRTRIREDRRNQNEGQGIACLDAGFSVRITVQERCLSTRICRYNVGIFSYKSSYVIESK